MKGGLKLKQEVAPHRFLATGGERLAQVWVDSSVYHLDQKFSYLIPHEIDEKIRIGSFVTVPFNGRELSAVVTSTETAASTSGLKSITKIVGSIPPCTPEILQLIEAAATRYACHPFDLIRSAISDRMATLERNYLAPLDDVEAVNTKVERIFLQLPPAKAPLPLIAQKVEALANGGGVIAVLPTSREVQNLSSQLSALGVAHTVFDSSQPKSIQYQSFLDVRTGLSKVVIGTRSSIFAPVRSLRNIIIVGDNSEHFYEQRSPGWNVRDIALLRSKISKVSLTFIGYTPSAELMRLIDEKWVSLKRARGKVKVSTFEQINGELLPSRAISNIKRALATGPVLFLVPQKGYAQAIRCTKCRTIARCQCGGALEKRGEQSPITCNHCLAIFSPWKCLWCGGVTPSIISRGIERHQHEIGLLFPGVSTHFSTKEHPVSETAGKGIYLATPGMAPMCKSGYSAIVVLEGDRFLNQPDLRASDRTREIFFTHAALGNTEAHIILIQGEGHSISTALTTWNPFPIIAREMTERSDLGLPPFSRAATLTMELTEIVKLQRALSTAREEGRIPKSSKILGPIKSGNQATLVLTVDVHEGDHLVGTLHEFMKRRSLAKKSMPTLRIDPYSLSH
ncbi:MAG: hypothetical protein RLZZ364_377 [Actinomycetota bacterium]